MAVSYKKLWKMLIDKDMKKKDLCAKAGISTASVTKMGKGGHVTTEVLAKICAAMDCTLDDIMEIIPEQATASNAMCKAAASEVKYLTKYIQCTTPMLMYEFDDISPLINTIRKHDRLKDRQAEMDADMTRFHSLENIYVSFTGATLNTPFAKLNDTTQIAILGGIKSELKKLVYRFIVRVRDLKGEILGSAQQQLFDEYIQYLYWQHSGNERKLLKLYEATQRAVLNWDGKFDSDTICIDDSNDKFWVLEQLHISPAPYGRKPEAGEVLRFSSTLKLRFIKDGSDTQTAEISMDYALFEMISAMREGYRPTVQDKNQHTDFVSFVQRLIEFGNKASRISLVPKDGEQHHQLFPKPKRDASSR